MTEFLIPLVLGLAVFAIAFLVLREFFCWYFKINQLIRIQKINTETQLKIYEQNGGKVDWDKANKAIHGA